MMTCEQCREELDVFALGQHDRARTDAIEHHLRHCAACRRERQEIEDAWALLPLSLAPSPPSPATRARALAANDSASVPAPRGVRGGEPLTRRARVASYALAGCLALGLTLWLTNATTPPRPAVGRVADEQAVRDLARRLGNLQHLERALGSGATKLATLKRPDAAATQAYVVWDLESRQWHFLALDLPPAPRGKSYQLWAAVNAGATIVPGPTFAVDDEGVGGAVAHFPDLDPAAPTSALITIEPASGSSAPTGEPVLQAPL